MMIWDSNIFTFSLNGLKLPENLLQPHTMLIKLYLDYQLKMYSDWKALNNSPSWPDSLWNYQLWFVWVNITSSSCIFTSILIKSELNYFKSCTSVMDVKLKISTLQICKATFKTVERFLLPAHCMNVHSIMNRTYHVPITTITFLHILFCSWACLFRWKVFLISCVWYEFWKGSIQLIFCIKVLRTCFPF